MADVGANFSQFLSALVKYEENIELFWWKFDHKEKYFFFVSLIICRQLLCENDRKRTQ
jgi:hypothetical protein